MRKMALCSGGIDKILFGFSLEIDYLIELRILGRSLKKM
jgi:hypothetical protein